MGFLFHQLFMPHKFAELLCAGTDLGGRVSAGNTVEKNLHVTWGQSLNRRTKQRVDGERWSKSRVGKAGVLGVPILNRRLGKAPLRRCLLSRDLR